MVRHSSLFSQLTAKFSEIRNSDSQKNKFSLVNGPPCRYYYFLNLKNIAFRPIKGGNMTRHLAFLSEISLDDLARAGGKAANLGELAKAGFPVPSGFCVFAQTCDSFLKANNLDKHIEKIAATIDFSNLDGLEEKTSEIRDFFVNATIPEEISDAIFNAYSQLGADNALLVAVRSSVGTRDLARSSFPGQMDTYYNILGPENVLEHVKKCWASVWTARAAATIHVAGIDYKNVIIAPVVQIMAQADTAGVIFSSNPENSSHDELLIAAAYGLGEAVVGGNLTPDHYVVCKKSRDILFEKTGCKSFQIELDPEKGIGSRKIKLSGDKANAPCLVSKQIAELADFALRIEKHYGRPQDIEWAYVGGKLNILQSRRIKWIEPEPDEWVSEFDTRLKDPPHTFTSSNIGEVLPGVLTPLSFSLLKSLDYGFWKANHDIGMVDEPFPEAEDEHIFLGFFYGRAHLNLTTFGNMVSKVPGMSLDEFERVLPEDQEPLEGQAKWSLGTFPFICKVILKALVVRIKTPKELVKKTALVLAKIDENRASGLRGKTLEELMVIFDENSQDGMDIIALHIANSQMAVFYYEMLTKLTKKWLGDDKGTLASQLVTGLASLESAMPGFGIYDLYRVAAKSSYLSQIFKETKASDLLVRLEKKEKHADVKEFLLRLGEFLDKYGYRSVFEAEIMFKSWDQDPSFVFSMIQNYLGAEHVEDPREIEVRQKKVRDSALIHAHKNLSWPKRLIFNRILKEAHTFIPGRENNKAIAIMGMNEAKKFIRAVSGLLLKTGVLRHEDDIYFLAISEIETLIRGGRVEVDEKVARRRTEYERNQSVTLPVSFTGRPVLIEPAEAEVPESGILKGLSVSPGRVTGPARVITDPRKDAHIKSGEILVAPVTDASWTPLFLMASAIVVDVGGLLSHGSVIAREFGIPGVLNVLTGTQVIKTGQIITVDGSKGEVYL